MILVLTGPTGTGKSKLAISLANRINGEIVNVDAFQVYEKLRNAFAEYVEGCYFFKTSDLEALYCGEALKSKLSERMEVLEKQIKKNLEDIEEDYN